MKMSASGFQIISELTNWREVGFNAEVYVEYAPEQPRTPFICRDTDAYGPTYHKSLKAAKSAIRRENSTKYTPNFRWKEVG